MDDSGDLEVMRTDRARSRWRPSSGRGHAPTIGLDLRRGDHLEAERFVALYREEFVTLTRVASALVGDWGLAEDLVQTVFAEVFRRWSSLGTVDSLGGYLHRAVIHRCRSHYRTTERASRPRPTGVLRLVGDPADDAIASAKSAELRHALTLLSSRQRECVVAHFLLEQTETETAEMLGISVGSVRTHTRRGLLALQKAMHR